MAAKRATARAVRVGRPACYDPDPALPTASDRLSYSALGAALQNPYKVQLFRQHFAQQFARFRIVFNDKHLIGHSFHYVY
jgi:hypothetical protein